MSETRNVKTRGISLPKELDRLLVERAQAEDRKVSTLVARALKAYLVESESQPQAQRQEVSSSDR